MNDGRWSQIKEILAAALERGAAERGAYLDDACAGDSGLRAEVDAYLAFEGEAAERLPVTRWHESSEEEAPPERLGPYRILRPLGAGGMGIVYLAERDDGAYRQQVAVKIMRRGAGGAELFRRERQILAGLRHTGIAALMDGGTTDDGRLYYVMEYVEGRPVVEFCRGRDCGVRARIQLFLRICDAVAHAHRNLVIHRDLKPANILVTADGRPKLLDFGLAKVFRASDGATVTQTGAALLTPAYASPEQVRGEPLSTATDIYSLGVVLYELVAGHSPYPASDTSPLETYRAVCEVEPKPPGQWVKLPRELDDIVLKALRKEPELRYATVEEFRQDLEDHLNGRPVRASRGSRLYRLQKFVRRHQWGAAVSVAALAAASLFLAAILYQWRQSELRFQQVRGLAHTVIFELHDAIEDLPGSTPARKLLVERALHYLRELESTGGKNQALHLEIAAAYQKIGDVQGHQSRANLGDLDGALDSFRHARSLLLAADSEQDEAQRLLVEVDTGLSDIYEVQGDAAGWNGVRAELAGLLRTRAARHPEQPELRARYVARLAHEAEVDRQWSVAVARWQEAIAQYGAIVRARPGQWEWARILARCQASLAHARQLAGDLAGSLAAYQEAERLHTRVVAAQPRNARARMELSFVLVEMGWIHHMLKDHRSAVADYQRTFALQERLAQEDPSDFRARIELAKLRITAAPTYLQAGDAERAAQLLREARTRLEEALAEAPDNQDLRLHVGWAELNLGVVEERRGRRAAALRAYEAARATLRALPSAGRLPGEFDVGKMLASAADGAARCLSPAGLPVQ